MLSHIKNKLKPRVLLHIRHFKPKIMINLSVGKGDNGEDEWEKVLFLATFLSYYYQPISKKNI